MQRGCHVSLQNLLFMLMVLMADSSRTDNYIFFFKEEHLNMLDIYVESNSSLQNWLVKWEVLLFINSSRTLSLICETCFFNTLPHAQHYWAQIQNGGWPETTRTDTIVRESEMLERNIESNDLGPQERKTSHLYPKP
jgi:hypothetical protein